VPEELLSLVAKALEQRGLRQETVQLREETERLKKRVQRAEAQLQPVYKNAKMRELFELVEQIAPSEANVLMVGESGVGKEDLRQPHPRAEHPLGRPADQAQLRLLPAKHDRGRAFRL
jgi:DNA-binding NtrC family response regulator